MANNREMHEEHSMLWTKLGPTIGMILKLRS